MHQPSWWSAGRAPYLRNEGTGRRRRIGDVKPKSGGLHELQDARMLIRMDQDNGGSIMQQGAVKFYKAEKGYGFIKPDGGGPDIFVHISAVEQAGLPGLSEGQRIAFDIEPDKKGKGPKAVNLRLL